MSTIKTNTISNVAGSLSIGVDRVAQGVAAAWVNFNGTGVVAIRASYNVTSITDNAVGDWTVNFSTALADTNFGVQITPQYTGAASAWGMESNAARASSSVRTMTSNGAGLVDSASVSVAVFR